MTGEGLGDLILCGSVFGLTVADRLAEYSSSTLSPENGTSLRIENKCSRPSPSTSHKNENTIHAPGAFFPVLYLWLRFTSTPQLGLTTGEENDLEDPTDGTEELCRNYSDGDFKLKFYFTVNLPGTTSSCTANKAYGYAFEGVNWTELARDLGWKEPVGKIEAGAVVTLIEPKIEDFKDKEGKDVEGKGEDVEENGKDVEKGPHCEPE
ncbi:uncharacterized protein LY79DRAFT_578747 [Colletotrichum navitas]|uniref:Uncharacterized protein n=1 Tax=Colletotrichum navitas TaxID=681940 RepID=A0AAD8Q288_9PEZI|nr:uncharacterized protein LY79DRAFT_578747 [Colletotrichum navitas]KAK1594100.1 hypothetical protein LY79DRAFT_578747 [Colletotrichum navitas]